ncbi:hypothetical protein H5410_021503 [Solanum commersonii]|uniref:Uncharacterized protein n=1 Tax=Solanum commersonii TaxID=4109 RepID=A0A9J5ZHE1_SOLCO|nr:hypothetical protein H5410_021503 [Solanum commersonii]
MSTHSLGHQSSGFGFTTSLSGKPKTHGKVNRKDHFQLGEEELVSSSLHKILSKHERKILARICSKVKNNNNNMSHSYCAAEDCSATLVEIADELGDLPFGQLIAFSVLPLASSHSGSLGATVLFSGTNQLRVLELRAAHVVLVTRQVKLTIRKIPFLVLSSPICFVLRQLSMLPLKLQIP